MFFYFLSETFALGLKGLLSIGEMKVFPLLVPYNSTEASHLLKFFQHFSLFAKHSTVHKTKGFVIFSLSAESDWIKVFSSLI